MRDEFFLDLKNRMLNRSMDLWGVKELTDVDPILDLLMDVFAYEMAELHREVTKSDTQLLHRLSRILISNKWSSPLPAHGLLQVFPNEDSADLSTINQFYANTPFLSNAPRNIFFTPLIDTSVYNAQVKYKIFSKYITTYSPNGDSTNVIFDADNKISDNSFWVGIEMSENLLRKIERFTFSVLLKNIDLYPYLNAISFYNRFGNNIPYTKNDFKRKKESEEHYYEEVLSYYQDYFYTINLEEGIKDLCSLESLFPNIKKGVEGIDYENNLFWIKIKFPNIFSQEDLHDTRLALNVVPIVNRFKHYKQHNFRKNGRIVSLPCSNKNYFLNIKTVQDDKGNTLQNVLKNVNNIHTGTYSLYFGDLEKFDARSAKVLINKSVQLIREEGNAFAAMNPEKLNTYLDEITEKLEVLENKTLSKLKNIDITHESSFLLTYPFEGTFNYEIEYWITNAELGNGFNAQTVFHQYATNDFDMKRTRLMTETLGGRIRREEREQIDSLRYGLLTKERIVSVEDINSYIKQLLGKTVSDVTVKPGVEISKEKKKGVVRTTEVHIRIDNNLSKINIDRLSAFIEGELSKKSISNTPYRVNIQ